MQKRVLPQFGEAVTAVLREHGLSDRGAQYRTGIDRITLADMRNGYVPRLEQVERFAVGFGLDVNEWRVLAGYEPVTDSSPADILLDGLLALQVEYPDAEIPLPRFSGGRRALTADEARQTVENMRDQLRRGVL